MENCWISCLLPPVGGPPSWWTNLGIWTRLVGPWISHLENGELALVASHGQHEVGGVHEAEAGDPDSRPHSQALETVRGPAHHHLPPPAHLAHLSYQYTDPVQVARARCDGRQARQVTSCCLPRPVRGGSLASRCSSGAHSRYAMASPRQGQQSAAHPHPVNVEPDPLVVHGHRGVGVYPPPPASQAHLTCQTGLDRRFAPGLRPFGHI